MQLWLAFFDGPSCERSPYPACALFLIRTRRNTSLSTLALNAYTIIHCDSEESDASCQHFYPPSVLNTMLVYYPSRMQHYHFATHPTPSHPQEKIHLPSMHRNWLWTGHGWHSFPLNSKHPCRILSVCWLGIYMYDQPGMKISLWSISYRYSGYTHHCKILSMSHYNKL